MVEKNSGLPILPPTPPSDPLPAKNKALTTNNANALRILEAKCVSLSLFPLPSPLPRLDRSQASVCSR
jgi:hypothetical protein